MLQMKAMGIPDVRHFPYPTPPDEDDVDRALMTLERLGALTPEEEQVTPQGERATARDTTRAGDGSREEDRGEGLLHVC